MQPIPPHLAALAGCLSRVIVPPGPHVFPFVYVHLPQFSCHARGTQSCGQHCLGCGCVHWRVSARFRSHCLPHAVASFSTERVRLCVPMPHVPEHSVHGFQSVSLQSGSQAHGLMCRLVSSADGASQSPLTPRTDRFLLTTAAPHVLLGADHGVHSPTCAGGMHTVQLLITPGTGQGRFSRSLHS